MLLRLPFLAVLAWGAASPGTAPPAPEPAPDPYVRLENGDDPGVVKWTRAQDTLASTALKSRPGREDLRRRLAALLATGEIPGIACHGKRLFFLQRSGSESQPRLYVRDAADEERRLVLDPARLSRDGSLALDWWQPSHDGMLVAYGVTDLRTQESTLRVREVDSAADLPDRIPRTPDASVAWLADRTGFFYTRLALPGAVPAGELAYHRRVYFHLLGSDWAHDPLVFGEGRPKEEWPEVATSPDGRYALVTAWQGTSRSELHYSDLQGETTAFVPVVAGVDAVFQGKIVDDTLFVLTNEGAARRRIMAGDIRRPFRVFGKKPKGRGGSRKGWREVVPEGPFTISDFSLPRRRLVVSVLERASSRLRVYDRSGKALREIQIPPLGTVRALASDPDADEVFILHESFLEPSALLRYGLAAGTLDTVESLPSLGELESFEARQVTYHSKDRTPVTMFLVHKKGLRKDRGAPAIVSGCGSFGEPVTPRFEAHLVAWLEKGGVWAVPNARGGGEYGWDWRRAGMLAKRQNSVDDLLAAGRWLLDQEYTRPEKLAAVGAGHCSVALGAALAQEPGLFRAVVLTEPLADLQRSDRLPPGGRWAAEYGSPADPAQDRWLAELSPYRRLAQGGRYPAVLIVTGERDEHFDPAHARKLVAKLQATTGSGMPALLRLHLRAGWSAGRHRVGVLEELLDRYTFLMGLLKVE
ncbi:MAG: S9 family peptidase [Elusimicrobia bacterium]|nr:S9 family peptidase [Elusimicrobiota bacterium]